MELIFTAQGHDWPVRLNDQALRTQNALLRALPLSLQLHTPKIAGSHIYWHAPFVEDAEGGVDVLDAKPGAFIYWPVRQFLEITFAPLQAETAEITVLGHLDAPVESIARLAEQLKLHQGQQIFAGTLRAAQPQMQQCAPPSPLPADIIEARTALWQACPADIETLRQSRAIMHPAGPIFTAESEARVLHELLWWIRARRHADPVEMLRYATALALNKAATRLRDFCHLQHTAALLFRLETAAQDGLPLEPLIDEAILAAGRIAAWLDLLIPWNATNEAFRLAYSEKAA